MKYFKYILLSIVVTSLIQILLWTRTGDQIVISPQIGEKLESLSYTPFKGFEKALKSDAEIAEDMKTIEHIARKVRTYAISDAKHVLENVQDTKLKVDVGLWLSTDKNANESEIETLFELIKLYSPRISSIIVGNEVLLRADLTPEELFAYIDRVSVRTRIPVTTAEVQHVWLSNTELARHVDFICVHILPYWEKVPIERTLAFTKEKYDAIAKMYPKKPITIGEFGWPSSGYNNEKAEATLTNQIAAITGFLEMAKAEKWTYNIVEAFDQPWKGVHEGSVGPYWGLFDTNKQPKFHFIKQTIINPLWRYQMAGSVFFGILLTFFGLRNQRVNFAHAITYSAASQAMGFGIAMAATYPFVYYMNFGMWIMWTMGIFLMIPLVIITLAKINELFKCTLGIAPKRLAPLHLKLEHAPFVSIHVPAYKEQPHVLIETLNSLAHMKYTNYEVLVIINNTPEEFYWKPIEEHCAKLGEKFVFLNITCKGFKAGALNEALKYTNEKAEILAVIDADYVVSEDWLIDLVPLFDDPKVGLVQAPQDHRDSQESLIKQAMNAEYAGFFDIGMVERNEENAIVAHGTMLMARLSAVHEVGDWTTYTIVEDSELGLRLFEAGYTAHYTNRRYGWGLLPDTVEAFRTQRHRWAYGAIQILKRHWRHFMPSSKTLTPYQKYHFVAGWFFWLSDAFGAMTAFLNIFWVPFIIFVGVTIPTLPLTLPILVAFLVNILHAFILYHTRVKMSVRETMLSAIASMSLQLVIFKAVYDGFVKDGLPFKRTEKGGNTKKVNKSPIRHEMILASLLTISFFALYFTNYTRITEIYVFSFTLLIQSVPYYSAIVLRIIELQSLKPKKVVA
ncbi:glycosyltransferase family 2 protein [Sulfurospirillum diekertiae]|uniref:glycosyltransferase family 2 protein n=1 Tax=Sulfurospirillum diekertiae TaxID=1854492 RepID=UPI000B4D5FBF|nr:glycosyltransferase family 2 protein [Sulfurospirillum diekertiae]ASC94163.1 Poly-beta-1,6-N-acetyl-D-glucosamine synthase [Sulfurospirillum diekertiae]